MKYLIRITVLLLISNGLLLAQDFEKENEAYRAKMNKEFKDPKESPLTKKDLKKFKELNFYPLNEDLYVDAKLILNTAPKLFKMPTTTDRKPMYSTYGELVFTIDSTEYTLQVFQNQELKNREGYEDYLFVPFTDETNGEDTYGGGRYLDFRIPKKEEVKIDFNRAYNPYCAYSDRYSCPIVPASNHLPIKIDAGVLNWGY